MGSNRDLSIEAPSTPSIPPTKKLLAMVSGVNELKCWWSYRNATKTTGTRKFPIRMTVGNRLGLLVRNITTVEATNKTIPVNSTCSQLSQRRCSFLVGGVKTFSDIAILHFS